ncbi:MAG TPA: hypothetical protein VFK13_11600 [Gemmatimonadaceae bacterium]|nr:hypothetical protein [Gemmatimonadaceae bacterium]
MKPRFAVILLAVATGACGMLGGNRAVEIEQTAVPVADRWNATLSTPAALAGALQMRGNAWMADVNNRGRAHVEIHIANAAPGGQHPWHVHRGTCGSDQGILGDANAYPILRVNGDGEASATVDLDVPVPTSGDYFVNVHAAPSNLGTVVACGNLAPPTR